PARPARSCRECRAPPRHDRGKARSAPLPAAPVGPRGGRLPASTPAWGSLRGLGDGVAAAQQLFVGGSHLLRAKNGLERAGAAAMGAPKLVEVVAAAGLFALDQAA